MEIAELLKQTATFRRNKARPEWENLTTEDFICSAPCEQRLGLYFGAGAVYLKLRQYTLEQEGGQSLWFVIDPDNARIHRYWWDGAENLVQQEHENRILRPLSLTPGEAVEKAKAYVKDLMGGFPNDLVLDYIYVPGPAPSKRIEVPEELGGTDEPDVRSETFWEVRFTRYAGAVPYDRQAVLIRFSEHYGVLSYTNQYFDKWEGKVTVSAEKAIAIAERAHEKNPENSYFYFSDQANPLKNILERPMYVKDGRPSLKPVVKDNPRAVHAVWTVVLPYAIVREKHGPGPLRWEESELYVDAETGEFLGAKEYG